MELPTTLQAVVDQFSKLPGVGPKTALRQSLIISKWTESEIIDFAQSLTRLNELQSCQVCGMMTDQNICSICQDEKRDRSIICVVENINDLLVIENSNQYKGLYHVVGGVLNPLLGIGPDQLNLKSLINRVKDEEVEELVLALNPSVEGDATCSYLNEFISDHAKVYRIGYGVPIGGSLEYLDSMTISKAFENRRTF